MTKEDSKNREKKPLPYHLHIPSLSLPLFYLASTSLPPIPPPSPSPSSSLSSIFPSSHPSLYISTPSNETKLREEGVDQPYKNSLHYHICLSIHCIYRFFVLLFVFLSRYSLHLSLLCVCLSLFTLSFVLYLLLYAFIFHLL